MEQFETLESSPERRWATEKCDDETRRDEREWRLDEEYLSFHIYTGP